MQDQAPREMPPGLDSGDTRNHTLHGARRALDEAQIQQRGRLATQPTPIVVGNINRAVESLSPLGIRGVIMGVRNDDSLKAAFRVNLQHRFEPCATDIYGGIKWKGKGRRIG